MYVWRQRRHGRGGRRLPVRRYSSAEPRWPPSYCCCHRPDETYARVNAW